MNGIRSFYKKLYSKVDYSVGQNSDEVFFSECPLLTDINKCKMDESITLDEMFKALKSCKNTSARHPPDLRLSEILLIVNGPRESWATVLTLSPAVPLLGISYLLTVWLGHSKELNLFFFFSARYSKNERYTLLE